MTSPASSASSPRAPTTTPPSTSRVTSWRGCERSAARGGRQQSPRSRRGTAAPLRQRAAHDVRDTTGHHMKPLWSYGFRPFFLLAAAFAATSVIVWVLVLRGAVALPPGLPPFAWHGHEMLFGSTSAVLAGFLLTAVRNWTGGQPTLEGRGLIVLVVIWLAGRVLALLPIAVPAAVHALV